MLRTNNFYEGFIVLYMMVHLPIPTRFCIVSGFPLLKRGGEKGVVYFVLLYSMFINIKDSFA